MKSRWKEIPRQIFAFLSSVQLAVVVLLLLAAVLAVATFLESLHDTPTAKYYVYDTLWFSALLGLLGLNVFFAALSRWPWKRRHTGFLVVHLGILIILAGSFLTLFSGYEGQLIIAEGETRDRMFLQQAKLFFLDSKTGQLEEWPAEFRFEPPSPEHPLGAQVLGDVVVKVEDYLPNAREVTEVISGGGLPNPALKMSLQGSRASMEDWIFSREVSRQNLVLGPATIHFIEIPSGVDPQSILDQPELRGPVLAWGTQLFPLQTFEGKAPIPQYPQLILENILPHAAVYQDALVNLSDRPENPAVRFRHLTQKGEVKNLTFFLKFPEQKIEAAHLVQAPDFAQLRLLWIPEALGTQDNELLLVRSDAGEIRGAWRRQGQWQTFEKFSVGQEVATGWMDFKFKIIQILENAEIKKDFKKVVVAKGGEGPPPALRLSVSGLGSVAPQSFWLGRGQVRDVEWEGRAIKIAYALKNKPLGFSVQLKNFHMGTYEGTQNPASYESDVVLEDKALGIHREQKVAMNQPLVHGKYKIFQASYQLDPSGADISVFAVSYDPGIFLKYLGSVILVLGTILIFFFRPAFTKRNKKSLSSLDGSA